MVVNLCLPHFYTTAHCNKLCADGYDVTNLVSADPALRNRGFKLEYFLRPPVQVTLKFGFQVELCRVDVELWPLGMDRGQACRRLEISTNCDSLSSTGTKDFEQKEQIQMKLKGQNAPNREDLQNHESKFWQSNGHQWSVQAQQWGEEAQTEPRQRGHVFKHQSNPESSYSEPEFKLVARCELKEETKVCFTHLNFCPRPPFLSPPPPQPANCQQEELWSRGLLSLGAVTQLRVTVPCGGAASSLGLKSLAVWGQPARSCPAVEVERIKKVHEASKRQLQQPAFFAPAIRQSKQPLEESPRHSIPEEFLDPITQEVMTLPMLLPSGVSVDNSTLEEYQKREATWGRSPNDPFTGVPFTSTFCPLPNPQLKSRIDHFLLQKGMMRRDGMLGRGESGENPQASRLLVSEVHEQSQSSLCLTKCSNSAAAEYNADTSNTNRTVKTDAESEDSSDNKNHTSNAEPLSINSKSALNRRKKQDLTEIYKESTDTLTAERHLQSKKQKSDAESVPSCSSHEQRLSASLDEALFSALQGRPSFTSNLHQQKRVSPDSERLNTTQQNSGVPSSSTGEKMCSACSCSVSVYSSASSIYRLSCGHLLCRACLQKKSSSLKSATSSTSNHIVCPTCQRPTPRALITRVHH